jgi:hypothetical protein
MKRIAVALVSGILFGFGVGAGMEEMWLMSIAFYCAAILGLGLFVRNSLRRIF